MKKWILKGMLMMVLIFASACGSDQSKEAAVAAPSPKLSNEESIEAEMAAIDEASMKSDLAAYSLNYNKESGESIRVVAHLTPENVILKLDENFSEGSGGNNGTITYYMKEKFPFATREYFEDNSNPQESKFVERISYYDAKGKVLSTKEKRVNYEEDLQNTNFVSVPLHACSVDRAMQVLEQKGEFETTFQGFAKTNSMDYLIVGQPGKDGYSSALGIEMQDPFIQDAMRNESRYLNKKCRVTFSAVQASSGFEYQMYIAGEWVD